VHQQRDIWVEFFFLNKTFLIFDFTGFASKETKSEGGVERAWVKSYFLNHFDCGQQVQTEVNEGPVNAFLFIFFLFEDEHVVIEELLQSFIREIDAKLFESVVLLFQEDKQIKTNSFFKNESFTEHCKTQMTNTSYFDTLSFEWKLIF
jgi:hypothetical protein